MGKACTTLERRQEGRRVERFVESLSLSGDAILTLIEKILDRGGIVDAHVARELIPVDMSHAETDRLLHHLRHQGLIHPLRDPARQAVTRKGEKLARGHAA